MSQQTQPEEEMPAGCPEFSQSETMRPEEEKERGLSQAGTRRRHVIKNVDEIFITIEALMNKLHKLKVSLRQCGST